MFFTKEDIQKLKKCLLVDGKKDTDFDQVYTANKGDWFAFVQNNKNVKIQVGDFLKDNIEWSSLSPALRDYLESILSRIEFLESLHPGEIGPHVPDNKWYVGQITRKSYEFQELTKEELLEVSQSYPLNIKEAVFVIHESCWFIMVPDGTKVIGAAYTDNGLVSHFTQEEIENGFISQVYHDDIEIDGITYHVYVNRNAGLETNTPIDGVEKMGIEGRFRIE